MIVNFGPGGGADQLGRVMSKLLEPVLGVPLPVANIAGASGNAGLTKILTSTADGYTVGTLTGLSISAWASGLGKMQVADFAVIAVVQSSPSMLFVPQHSKIADLQGAARGGEGDIPASCGWRPPATARWMTLRLSSSPPRASAW